MPESVFIIAGEASADHHAAKVVRELTAQGASCFGMGGDRMQAAGCDLVAHAHELSVMGFLEVVKNLRRILGVERRLQAAVLVRKPKVAVLLDLPDFNLRMARFLKAQGVYVIYYISPQVWAWRASRTKLIARVVDEMLCVLPFEPDFYAARQVRARFVGHPLVEDLADKPSPESLRQALALGEAPVIALLPGSRRQESRRLLGPMFEAASLVAKQHPEVRFVLPLAGTVAPSDVEALKRAHTDVATRLSVVQGRSQEVLALARGAVVASGTATLEAALIGTPTVAVYRMSQVTFFFLKRIVSVASVILANLILGQNRIVELLQHEASAQNIARHLVAHIEGREATVQAQDIRQALLDKLGERRATDSVVHAVQKALGAKG